MDFGFERSRIDKIPKEEIIKELTRVAELYNFRKFGWREFDEVSQVCKSACVKKNFGGSWNKALDSIGLPLKERSKRKFSNDDLFIEMERIWRLLGHRPSRVEWEISRPRISYNSCRKYFDGWTNACLKFIEYKMGKDVQLGFDTEPTLDIPTQPKVKIIKRQKRDIPLRLRLRVLKRDGFKCVFCGRSPAIDPGVVLHIDHILPVVKGGATNLENLQTLCRECNLGKSDDGEYRSPFP